MNWLAQESARGEVGSQVVWLYISLFLQRHREEASFEELIKPVVASDNLPSLVPPYDQHRQERPGFPCELS